MTQAQPLASGAKDGASRALRLAISAIAVDVAIVVIARTGAYEALGPAIRNHAPLLAGYCLTWSFWAPLLLAMASILAIVLAYRAPWYEAARGTTARALVAIARFTAVLTTIAWGIATLIVAYADVSTCIKD